jgi:hypothetical protein
MERMIAGNIPLKRLKKLVKDTINQNPAVFKRLEEL